MNISKLLFTLHYKRCSQNVYQLKRICQRHVIIMPTIEFSWTKAHKSSEPLYDHLISVFPLHAWKRIHLIVLKMIIVSYVTRSKLHFLSIYLMYTYVSSVDHQIWMSWSKNFDTGSSRRQERWSFKDSSLLLYFY